MQSPKFRLGNHRINDSVISTNKLQGVGGERKGKGGRTHSLKETKETCQ